MKQFTRDPWPQHELNTVTIDNQRFYITPQGSPYPSVTTVLGWRKRAFFANWRKNNKEEASRVTTRGTKFHSLIENYLITGQESPASFSETFLFKQLQPQIDQINKIHLQEAALWSHLMRMAGRCDCVGEFNGVLSLIDFKTASRMKAKHEIEDYFMQATAYSIMIKELYNQRIDNIVILMSSEDGMTATYQESAKNFVRPLFDVVKEYHENNATVQ